MPDPRIVALDLSLTSTGVAVNHPGGIVTHALRNSKTGPARLGWIRSQVRTLIDPPGFPADLVVLEGYSFGSRNHRAEAIGELGGVIRLDLFEFGFPYVVIAPAELKKYATGKGNASKDAVFGAAVHRSGREFATTDEADAWWLCQMALAHYDLPHIAVPKTQTAVLDKIPWPALPAMEVPA